MMLYGGEDKPWVPVSIAIEFLPGAILIYKASPIKGYETDTIPIGKTYIAGDALAEFPYEIGMEVLPRGWRERDNSSNGRTPPTD